MYVRTFVKMCNKSELIEFMPDGKQYTVGEIPNEYLARDIKKVSCHIPFAILDGKQSAWIRLTLAKEKTEKEAGE